MQTLSLWPDCRKIISNSRKWRASHQGWGKIKVTGPGSHGPTTWSFGPDSTRCTPLLCTPLLCTHASHGSGCRATLWTSLSDKGGRLQGWNQPAGNLLTRNARLCFSLCPTHILTNRREQSLRLAALTSGSPGRRAKALTSGRMGAGGGGGGGLSHLWLFLSPLCVDSSAWLLWPALGNRRGPCALARDRQISVPNLWFSAEAQGALCCDRQRGQGPEQQRSVGSWGGAVGEGRTGLLTRPHHSNLSPTPHGPDSVGQGRQRPPENSLRTWTTGSFLATACDTVSS